eukprot:2512804-Pyramimonas_sp.AAC.1
MVVEEFGRSSGIRNLDVGVGGSGCHGRRRGGKQSIGKGGMEDGRNLEVAWPRSDGVTLVFRR